MWSGSVTDGTDRPIRGNPFSGGMRQNRAEPEDASGLIDRGGLYRRANFRSGTSCSRLGSNRINDLQKRELMKIGIAGTDLPNAMLAHENCRMRIMQQITSEMR
jgi:hypothetical protein